MKAELLILICLGITLFIFVMIFIIKSFIKLRIEELAYFPNSQHLKIVSDYHENETIRFSLSRNKATNVFIHKQKEKDTTEKKLTYDVNQMYVTTNCL